MYVCRCVLTSMLNVLTFLVMFEAILPENLPPTYRGRMVRISYKLILGIQKTIYDKPYFIQLPFRVFNAVTGNFLFLYVTNQ
jgi:hypothetical protein